MSLHAQHSISSAFCMYGSELLGGLQSPEPPPPPPPPPLDPPLVGVSSVVNSSVRQLTFAQIIKTHLLLPAVMSSLCVVMVVGSINSVVVPSEKL